jgi:hypothetical protein
MLKGKLLPLKPAQRAMIIDVADRSFVVFLLSLPSALSHRDTLIQFEFVDNPGVRDLTRPPQVRELVFIYLQQPHHIGGASPVPNNFLICMCLFLFHWKHV